MPSKKLTSKTLSDLQLKKRAEETAKAVKNAAKTIREVSSSTHEAVKAFSDSGAVMELAESVQVPVTDRRRIFAVLTGNLTEFSFILVLFPFRSICFALT